MDDTEGDTPQPLRLAPSSPSMRSEQEKAAIKQYIRDNKEGKPIGKPVRTKVRNWNEGSCKRCLKQGAPDGSVVVKIFGTGWWHDACYRKVDPDFYTGLD